MFDSNTSKVEYGDYRKAVAEWEKLTGEKVDDSLKAKLQQKQQEAKAQNKHTEHYQKKDRGARQYWKWSGKLLRFFCNQWLQKGTSKLVESIIIFLYNTY